MSHASPRHTLDGAEVHAALLDLVVQLGRLLRRREQAARGLSLTLRFAGGPSWEKTRHLPEVSAHDDDLRTMAYRLIDAAGLQRGRLGFPGPDGERCAVSRRGRRSYGAT